MCRILPKITHLFTTDQNTFDQIPRKDENRHAFAKVYKILTSPNNNPNLTSSQPLMPQLKDSRGQVPRVGGGHIFLPKLPAMPSLIPKVNSPNVVKETINHAAITSTERIKNRTSRIIQHRKTDKIFQDSIHLERPWQHSVNISLTPKAIK